MNQTSLRNYEVLLKQANAVLQRLLDEIDTLRRRDPLQENDSGVSQQLNMITMPSKLKRTLAEITPINTQDFEGVAPYLHLRDQISSKPLNQEYLNKSGLIRTTEMHDTKRSYPIQTTQEDTTLQYQDLSKAVDEMRADLINRIMSAATNKVNKQDVTDILDLYTALVGWQKDGITKVLKGQTDTSKSRIYNAVVGYAKFKQSELTKYRNIYIRLCDAFGQEVMQIVYQIVEAMTLKKKHMLNVLKKGRHQDNLSWQDYVCIIVVGANPLYPVQEHEVEAILELYTALAEWKREGITKVLSGQTDSGKSRIYNAVVENVTSQQSNLEIYRDIYRRVSQSLDGQAMQVVRNMMDKERHGTVEKGKELSPSDKKVL
jgi:hypothetical protein